MANAGLLQLTTRIVRHCLMAVILVAFGWLPRLGAATTPQDGFRFSLGDSGVIRAFWVEGPFATDREPTQTSERVAESQPSAAGAVYETNTFGALDFNAQFGLRGSGSDRLVAKGTLEVVAPVDGWLLVRADGWLSVTIDGKSRFRRTAPLGRARGWEALALTVQPGLHAIRLDCRRLNDRWSLAARFIDRTGHAPPGAAWHVPGRARALKGSLEPFDVSLTLSAKAPAGLNVKIDAPLGTEVQAESPLTLHLRTADGTLDKTIAAGAWPSKSSPLMPFVIQMGSLSEWISLLREQDQKLTLDISVGPYHVRRTLNFPRSVVDAWQSITRQLESLQAGSAADLDVVRASLQSAESEVTAAVTEGKSAPDIRRTTTHVLSLCDAIARGRAPWSEPGIHDLAWRASADGSIQPFALQVPKPSEANERLPLVLVLHGYNGTPRRILDAFFDVVPGETPKEVRGFVLAPAAHGNAFYRGPGERDVLEILDWALRSLPVDANRVTITGASMGGTGTAEIALHYPDSFAALAPLCGYQSYFVRRDTSGQPIRAWERKLMHRNSAASSAESGRTLPMYLAHGMKDRPLENSRVLTTRYKTLGYKLIEDWPNLGHAVWKKTWAHAGLFPWLSAQERAVEPRRITLAATALRHAQSHWLHVLELDSQAEISTIDAEIIEPDSLRIVSKGVLAFAISDTHTIDRSRPVRFEIDGAELTAAARTSLTFQRIEGRWTQGDVRPGKRKTRGVEGPWLDLWSEPLVFVYGTGSPATLGVNREVARTFAAPQGDKDGAYPVLSDVEYMAAEHRDKVAIFVGNATDHAWLAQWKDRLPWTLDAQSIRFGGRTFTSEKLGALFVYPNPETPDRIMGVVTAPTPQGLWLSLSLPMLLPDFMVFDSRATLAAGEPILGRRGHVLAAGFFNNDWSIPSRLNDALDESTDAQ